MPTTTWIVQMVIAALPQDREAFFQDLPEHAEAYFAEGRSMAPRTGIAMRMRTKTASRAITLAMNVTIDLQVNFGHVSISALEIYTEDDFRDRILPSGNTSFRAALRGASRLAAFSDGLGDIDRPAVFEDR
jgi:hypothetical protein